MSSLALYAEAGCLYSLCRDVFKNMFKCIMDLYQYSGLVISPLGGKSFIQKHIDSSDTIFINLDEECKEFLSDSGGDASAKSSVSDNLKFYRRAQEVLKDLVEVHSKTSKQVTKICLLTRDFRLLKFLGIGTITYTIPTKLYYDNLKLDSSNPSYKAVSDYRENIVKYKEDKLKTYSSTDDLLKLVCDLYSCKAKI